MTTRQQKIEEVKNRLGLANLQYDAVHERIVAMLADFHNNIWPMEEDISFQSEQNTLEKAASKVNNVIEEAITLDPSNAQQLMAQSGEILGNVAKLNREMTKCCALIRQQKAANATEQFQRQMELQSQRPEPMHEENPQPRPDKDKVKAVEALKPFVLSEDHNPKELTA